MTRKSRQLGVEAAGHIAFIVRKQRDDHQCASHCLIFIQSGILAQGMVSAIF